MPWGPLRGRRCAAPGGTRPEVRRDHRQLRIPRLRRRGAQVRGQPGDGAAPGGRCYLGASATVSRGPGGSPGSQTSCAANSARMVDGQHRGGAFDINQENRRPSAQAGWPSSSGSAGISPLHHIVLCWGCSGHCCSAQRPDPPPPPSCKETLGATTATCSIAVVQDDGDVGIAAVHLVAAGRGQRLAERRTSAGGFGGRTPRSPGHMPSRRQRHQGGYQQGTDGDRVQDHAEAMAMAICVPAPAV